MKQKSLCFFLLSSFFLLLSSHPASAAGWVEMEKGTIQGVQAITKSGNVYFAVGNSGKIIRSTDGGITWTLFEQSASVYWQDVETSGAKVYVIGEAGTVRQSTDGGATFSQLSLSVTENLYDMDTGVNTGYMVGAGGRILYYGSAANIWHTPTSPTSLALFGVHDRGDGTGWIVGAEGVLLYTGNSGITWTNKGKAADTDLNAVWFSSASVGYVVGKNGTIRKTADGGVSWTTINVTGLSTQTLFDIEAVGDDLVIAGDKVIVRSQDGGATWSVSDYTSANYRFTDVYYPSAGELWVAGTMDDVKSVILHYTSVIASPAEGGGEAISPGDTVADAVPNSLIKLSCASGAGVNDPCKAVYFYGSDGKRHAFPNDKVFFTWYDNFDGVKEVSKSFLSLLSLGKNVTYHPGTKMVKFQSVNTVYAVSKTGMLRAIGSEQVAGELYGTDWNKKIDDISDAFYGNYTFGAKIEKMGDYDVAAEKTSVSGLDGNF